jgi:hypothetical protein
MDLSSWGKHGTKWGIFQQAMFDDTGGYVLNGCLKVDDKRCLFGRNWIRVMINPLSG